jgi:hypothetical protein
MKTKFHLTFILSTLAIISTLVFAHTPNKSTELIDLELPAPKLSHHPLTISEHFLYNELVTKYQMEPEEAEWWSKEIAWAALQKKVPDSHLLALIAVESSFNKSAISSVGAIGPAQVIPEYWNSLGYDLNNPSENIMAGAEILYLYKEECGSWRCALAAYNVGITNYTLGKQVGAQQRYLAKIQNQLSKFNVDSL